MKHDVLESDKTLWGTDGRTDGYMHTYSVSYLELGRRASSLSTEAQTSLYLATSSICSRKNSQRQQAEGYYHTHQSLLPIVTTRLC